MHSTLPSSSTSPSRPSASGRHVTAARMPIEGPVEDTEAAVEQLQQCSSTELRRARTHHRRALASLENGGYNNLSDATRERLSDQLRSNLEALNRALATGTDDNSPPESPTPEGDAPSLFTRLWSFVQRPW